MGAPVGFIVGLNRTGFIFKIKKSLIHSMYKKKLLHMGNSVSIHPNVYMRNPEKITIGNSSNINHGCELYGAGGITIGSGTMVAYNTMIMSDSRTFMGSSPLKSRTERISKPVIIGDDVWIGAGSIILPGLIISDHAIVAAGSIVTKNVSEWDIVGGNPAKKISSRI